MGRPSSRYKSSTLRLNEAEAHMLLVGLGTKAIKTLRPLSPERAVALRDRLIIKLRNCAECRVYAWRKQ